MGRKLKVSSASRRISSQHQVTIPIDAFREAGLQEGDVVRFEVEGPGRLRLTRLEDLLDAYAGCLSGVLAQEGLQRVRDEWER